MRLRSRTPVLLTCLALAGPILSGCGGSGLSASSSCQDFLSASTQDQDAAVSKLAGELHAPDAVTPLGRPNVNYLCANEPNMTLGDAVSKTG
jgi:hypothetical protein